jgi:hypothetical protein
MSKTVETDLYLNNDVFKRNSSILHRFAWFVLYLSLCLSPVILIQNPFFTPLWGHYRIGI